VYWIEPTQDMVQWLALVKKVTNVQVEEFFYAEG
jgi:hypothetical protein